VLFEQIPLAAMNTSMTINATAAWLMALYIAVADEQGAPRKDLQGTTQNDIIKEYLSRGAYVFPPGPSMRLIKDVILFTTKELPRWNPMNVCSFHLQEAGATPVHELAYALATAVAVLDAVKASGDADTDTESRMPIPFFCRALSDFAFARGWCGGSTVIASGQPRTATTEEVH
jgi:ethylmalonyl-CoA mutase